MSILWSERVRATSGDPPRHPRQPGETPRHLQPRRREPNADAEHQRQIREGDPRRRQNRTRRGCEGCRRSAVSPHSLVVGRRGARHRGTGRHAGGLSGSEITPPHRQGQVQPIPDRPDGRRATRRYPRNSRPPRYARRPRRRAGRTRTQRLEQPDTTARAAAPCCRLRDPVPGLLELIPCSGHSFGPRGVMRYAFPARSDDVQAGVDRVQSPPS